jgi:deoxyribodipyrimidine photo-lyase
MTQYEKGLFIFRRDLRVVDNIGLNLLNSKCKQIYPVFIFTPEQVTSANSFKSDNAVQFMIESLEDLHHQTNNKLLVFYGHNEKIVSQLIQALEIDCVGFNSDYSPYAIKRDIGIIQLCNTKGIALEIGQDYYLHAPGSILNGSGQTYQKFTPFYEASLRKKVEAPTSKKNIKFVSTNKNLQNSITLEQALKRFTKVNPNILVHGGRNNGLKQMKIASKNIANYPRTHNDLSHSTSQLSAYIKFGCVSIREVYKAYHSKRDFIRQLYWRDFYANILFAFPQVLGHALKPKYDKIHWKNNHSWFQKWCNGETGYPVVDAGMRQLNATGYMHNRARLIVSSFLVKTLLISWEQGEKYFACKLTDYDPASNNGNWQWQAGSGADSQPYFRIFNPWLQTKEYDPDCEYIKTWIPELKDVPNKDILNWDKTWSNYKQIKYFKPMVDYAEQKDKVLQMYKSALY